MAARSSSVLSDALSTSDLSEVELETQLPPPPSSRNYGPSPSVTPTRRPFLDPSPSQYAEKRRRTTSQYSHFRESSMGVHTSDINSSPPDPRLPSQSKPRGRPPIKTPVLERPKSLATEDKILDIAVFNNVCDKIGSTYDEGKNKVSVARFLKTIMFGEDIKHRVYQRSLRKELLRPNNPFVVRKKFQFVNQLLDQHEWKPVHRVLRRECQRYGKNVVKQYKRPQAMDESFSMQKDMESFGNRALGLKYAPHLVAVLEHCGQPLRRDSAPRRDDDEHRSWAATSFQISYLAFRAAPQSYDRFATWISLALGHQHLTRRGLEILDALGLSISYSRLCRIIKQLQLTHADTLEYLGSILHRLIVYDNLNRTDNVRETRVGDEKRLQNVTTGLVKVCRHIPKDGIPSHWLKWTSDLETMHILPLQPEAIIARKDRMREVSTFSLLGRECGVT